MIKFNEWLQNRDPELCESMVGRLFRHIQADDRGAMPEDDLTAHRLGNELDATDLSGMPEKKEFQIFAKMWQDFHPHHRIPRDEMRGLFQKMLRDTARERANVQGDLNRLHHGWIARQRGEAYP